MRVSNRIVFASLLVAGAGVQPTGGAAPAETWRETAQAYGWTPDGVSVAVSVSQVTESTGASHLYLFYSITGPEPHAFASCTLPPETFVLATHGSRAGDAALSLTSGAGVSCTPSPTPPVELRFAAVPGEFESSHEIGERSAGTWRYDVQRWDSTWDTQAWVTIGTKSYGPIEGQTSITRERTSEKP